jgi:four helix bundle protein
MGANIAEGCGSRGNAEFHRFLQIAGGAGSELDYHILLAHDLHFLAEADYRKLTADLLELRKTLTSLLQKVNLERAMAKC